MTLRLMLSCSAGTGVGSAGEASWATFGSSGSMVASWIGRREADNTTLEDGNRSSSVAVERRRQKATVEEALSEANITVVR